MFRLRQPDTLIELVSLITTQQEEKIRRGELDVGLMRHPVYSPEIDYLELFDEPLVVVLPVDHPLSSASKRDHRRATGWREFRQYRSGASGCRCADR